jgi:hypothetical protein
LSHPIVSVASTAAMANRRFAGQVEVRALTAPAMTDLLIRDLDRAAHEELRGVLTMTGASSPEVVTRAVTIRE